MSAIENKVMKAIGEKNTKAMVAMFGKPKKIDTKKLIIKPKKLYVISSSEFETQGFALDQIINWELNGTLGKNAKVYEV